VKLKLPRISSRTMIVYVPLYSLSCMVIMVDWIRRVSVSVIRLFFSSYCSAVESYGIKDRLFRLMPMRMPKMMDAVVVTRILSYETFRGLRFNSGMGISITIGVKMLWITDTLSSRDIFFSIAPLYSHFRL
jgi:hypothetical protein